MEEQKTIKLSNEQITEKEVQLFKTNMQIEMTELNIKHYIKAIKEGIPEKENAIQLNDFKKQMDVLKHNAIALKEQIDKREM